MLQTKLNPQPNPSAFSFNRYVKPESLADLGLGSGSMKVSDLSCGAGVVGWKHQRLNSGILIAYSFSLLYFSGNGRYLKCLNSFSLNTHINLCAPPMSLGKSIARLSPKLERIPECNPKRLKP